MGNYTKQKNLIAAARVQRNVDRNSEFKFTQSQLGTIYGNLGTTLGGGKAQLTAAQDRQMSALSRLKTNQLKKSGAIVTKASSDIRNSYGSGIAGYTNVGLNTTAATAKAGSKAVLASAAGGAILNRGNNVAYASLQQGAVAARAGADAQLADALSYRAHNDAALTIQAKLDLAKQQDAFKQAVALAQAQHDIQLGKAVGKDAGTAAEQLISSSGIALEAANDIRSGAGIDPTTGKYSASYAATQYATEHGYVLQGSTGAAVPNLEDPHVKLYMVTMNHIHEGMTAQEAYGTAVKDLYTGSPGWNKWGADAVKAATTGANLKVLQKAWADSQKPDTPPADGGDGGGWSGLGSEALNYAKVIGGAMVSPIGSLVMQPGEHVAAVDTFNKFMSGGDPTGSNPTLAHEVNPYWVLSRLVNGNALKPAPTPAEDVKMFAAADKMGLTKTPVHDVWFDDKTDKVYVWKDGKFVDAGAK